MTNNRSKGLGRGFDSLIPTTIDPKYDPTSSRDNQSSRTQNVLIADIRPNPEQPRREFGEQDLLDLSNSIKTHGVLQPIVLIKNNNGYIIVAGERRWRAAKLAGLDSIPAIVRSIDEQAQLEVALIENIQRQDLAPLEFATALVKLNQQFNQTFAEIAMRVGKAPSTLTNTARLVQLPNPAKQALAKGQITEGHARQILAIDEPKSQQELLDYIVRHGWSVRRAEQFVTELKQGIEKKNKSNQTLNETLETRNLGKSLRTKVFERPMARGSGRIIISYKNQKDRSRIFKILGS